MGERNNLILLQLQNVGMSFETGSTGEYVKFIHQIFIWSNSIMVNAPACRAEECGFKSRLDRGYTSCIWTNFDSLMDERPSKREV